MPQIFPLPASRMVGDYATRTDIFTTTANGTTVDLTAKPCKFFSVQCKATGVVTLYTVVLEISLDGTNWTTALTQTQAADGALTLLTAGLAYPALYARTRCSVLTLGAGTNVVAILLAMP